MVRVMTLPNHLRTLLPNALEVLRYYQRANVTTADIDEICQDVGLSERGFGKAIRSLVTKGFVIMDGDQVYRLTEHGSAATAALATIDFDDTGDEDEDYTDEQLTRRLTLVIPRQLQAKSPTHVVVGFQSCDDQIGTAEIVTRLSVLNGEPSVPQEASFELDSDAAKQDFLVTADAYTQARIKIEVFQLGPNPGDIAVSGGLYVDVDVTTDNTSAEPMIAYGADITINDQD